MLNIVQTDKGLIQGIPCGNPAYTVFKGIPFAKPPVGDLRWEAPQDTDKWDGVLKCDEFAPISVQDFLPKGEFYQKEFFPVEMPMSEDCLYLNVWTPADCDTKGLPVMMWIHGGAFIRGYGHEMEFDGESFCKRGVILVTVPYRLGPLGYFAHPDLSKNDPNGVSGNYALLDLIKALEWIQNNIEAFGGDKDNVTVFGQSAGGFMTQSLAVSPLAKGLFHKAIVHSSAGITSLSDGYTLKAAEELGKSITDKLNITIDELKKMPAKEMTDLINSAIPKGPLRMLPNIDGYSILESPGASVALGKHADIQYMMGTVSEDGKLFAGYPNAKTVSEFEEYIKSRYGTYADKYLELFNVKNDSDVESAITALTNANSKLAPYSWANAHVKLGRNPVYVYYFNRDIPGEDHPGAFHSSELWYVFGTLSRCWRPMEAIDYKLSMVMSDYWTNFAKYGDPNGINLPNWPKFTKKEPVIMEINENKVEASVVDDKILIEMEKLISHKVLSNNT